MPAGGGVPIKTLLLVGGAGAAVLTMLLVCGAVGSYVWSYNSNHVGPVVGGIWLNRAVFTNWRTANDPAKHFSISVPASSSITVVRHTSGTGLVFVTPTGARIAALSTDVPIDSVERHRKEWERVSRRLKDPGSKVLAQKLVTTADLMFELYGYDRDGRATAGRLVINNGRAYSIIYRNPGGVGYTRDMKICLDSFEWK